jgi:hypothetical protein
MKKILNCCKNKVKYSKVVTAGNDPSITKRMRYSQYINNTKTFHLVSTPINYINQTNLFIEQYISKYNTNININLDNFYIFVQQYYLKRNVNTIIEDINNIVKIEETKDFYKDIDDAVFIKELNDWFNQYKTDNGVNINIENFNTFVLNLNMILQQYSEDSNIINMYLYDMTTNFLNGLINGDVYYNYLSRVFINLDKDYLSGLLAGMLPLMPIEKAFYLKSYMRIVDPRGSIWPHHNSNRPIKTNINFLKYY